MSDPMMLRVEYLPGNAVASQPVTRELIVQQLAVVAISHAVYVLDNERLGADDSKYAVEVLIQVSDRVSSIAPPALCEPLAGIATHKEIRARKFGILGHVARSDDGAEIVFVSLAGRFRDVICKDDLITEIGQRKVGATAAAEQRDCSYRTPTHS